MKVTMELDCTPEEARRSLGLPDVTKVNEIYVDAMAKAMQGGGFEQMQEYAKQIAPMGQAGLKLFQKMLESGAAAAMSGRGRGSRKTDA
jgi:shikimate kinase